MTDEEIAAATVARGTWLYDGCIKQPVSIVGLPFDYWQMLAEADDQLEKDETPRPLGAEGMLYHVRFAQFAGSSAPTIADAKTVAQSLVTVPIEWEA